MVLGFSTESIVLVTIIVFFAGTVTGITGFGYALIGTVGSTAVLGPQQAIVLMIIPVFVSNVPLLGELDHEQLLTCGRRFTSFIVAAAVGTIIGMVILQWIPTAVLMLGLGVFTLCYVAFTQDTIPIPGKGHITSNYFEQHANAQLGIGFGSGLIFGASNVGLVGVMCGQRIRHLLPDRYIEEAILVLLSVIGIRLISAGVGV